MADWRAARPAVKFKLTATLFAKVTATFATTAPAPGGNTTATRSPGHCFLIHRLSAMEAASRSPRFNTRPSIPSMIASSNGLRFRPRTVARPR